MPINAEKRRFIGNRKATIDLCPTFVIFPIIPICEKRNVESHKY